jgi:hypothetical protein
MVNEVVMVKIERRLKDEFPPKESVIAFYHDVQQRRYLTGPFSEEIIDVSVSQSDVDALLLQPPGTCFRLSCVSGEGTVTKIN